MPKNRVSAHGFRNTSPHTFQDVSSEAYREYQFAKDGRVVTLRIDAPLRLHVSSSGGHRVFDAGGVSHYVPAGWHHLSWKVKDDAPHFEF